VNKGKQPAVCKQLNSAVSSISIEIKTHNYQPYTQFVLKVYRVLKNTSNKMAVTISNKIAVTITHKITERVKIER
jgi:hypothetical protein